MPVASLLRVRGDVVEWVTDYQVASPFPPYIRRVEPPTFTAKYFKADEIENDAVFVYEQYDLFREDSHGRWAEYVYRVPQDKGAEHDG